MTDPEDPDNREITEEDVVVQTASGERYRASELSKSGHTSDGDDEQ